MDDDAIRRILDQVSSASSFAEAAERLTDAVRDLTGCEAAMLRFRVDDAQSAGWIPAVVERGFGRRFLRDEILIGQEECMCGRICSGCPDPDFPFFTEAGSFAWGKVQSIARDYPVEALGDVRGRCIQEGFESVAIIPLVVEDGSPVGCLHLADFAPEKFVDRLETLEELGRLSGPVLSRFPAGEREASVIRAVETALMPPEIEEVPGLDVAVSFTSATETARLGGDFYDVIELEDGGVVLVVGDYSGKGISAAGMAARARHAIASAAAEGRDLETLLKSAEAALRDSLPKGRFITVAVCRYSPDGKLEAAVAGHPVPLLLEPDGEIEELALPANRPVGDFKEIRFQSVSTGLPPDQTLLLYTDGIVESRRDDRFFGVEGIADHWRAASGSDLGALTAALCRESAEFQDDSRPGDDRLALAARPVAAAESAARPAPAAKSSATGPAPTPSGRNKRSR